MDSKKIPNTLKFILQLVMISFLLVVITSSVSLYLTYSNFIEARLGVEMTHLSSDRVGAVTKTRI